MKISTSTLKDPSTGIVYILYLSIEYNDTIHEVTKIGVTTRDVEARVVEILTAIWKVTRVFPRCYVKRFRTVQDPYSMESDLLGKYRQELDKGIGFDIKFSGSTECFLLDDRDSLIEVYEELANSDTYKKK